MCKKWWAIIVWLGELLFNIKGILVSGLKHITKASASSIFIYVVAHQSMIRVAKYYEPYYLLLSNPASMEHKGITIAKHTIPYFIPVQQMVDTFLPNDLDVSLNDILLELPILIDSLFSLYYEYYMCFCLLMYRDGSRWKNLDTIAKNDLPSLAFRLKETLKTTSSLLKRLMRIRRFGLN